MAKHTMEHETSKQCVCVCVETREGAGKNMKTRRHIACGNCLWIVGCIARAVNLMAVSGYFSGLASTGQGHSLNAVCMSSIKINYAQTIRSIKI